MGRQVRIYATKEDIKIFMQFADSIDLVVIPEYIKTRSKFSTHSPKNIRWNNDFGSMIYLMPIEFGRKSIIYYKFSENEKRIDASDTPVIEYNFRMLMHDIYTDGRIYLHTRNSFDREQNEFKLATKRYGQLKRFLNKWDRTDLFNIRVGPEASELISRGKAKAVLNPRDSLNGIKSDCPPYDA